MFTGKFIKHVRIKALRNGVWFTALDSLERGIMTLSYQLVNQVQSSLLGIEMIKIIKKIKNASKSLFIQWFENHSMDKVKQIATQTEKWNNEEIKQWGNSIGFLRYLTLIQINRIY